MLDKFYLARQNRKARKHLKMAYGHPDITKVGLMHQEIVYAKSQNGGKFPHWTRKEAKFIAYMAIRTGGI